MEKGFAPRLVSEKSIKVSLTGYLMPVDEEDQPTFLHMPGAGSDLFLPTFSSMESFRVYEKMPGSPAYAKLVQIEDGNQFLGSIPEQIFGPFGETRIRIVVDLRPHDDPEKRERGNIRFQEILER